MQISKCKIEMKKSQSFKTSSDAGFTLIEMMVAVSIFAVVMTVSAGSLLTIIDANNKSQSLKSVMNNLNFALENMSRNIRVGTLYNIESGINSPGCTGGTHMEFTPRGGGDSIIYKLEQHDLYPNDLAKFQIEKSIDGGSSFLTISSPEIVIEHLCFYGEGLDPSDQIQPRVLITSRGYAGQKEKIRTSFNLQTTVSQRQLDK